jgi:hypothetical protein
MASIIGSLCRKISRRTNEQLNILCMPTHERYETGLAKTGHNFYAFRAPSVKDWNSNYAVVPMNYSLLNPALGDRQIPIDLDFDVILSQNKFGQMQLAKQLAFNLHLPIISLEHTLPMPEWGQMELLQLQAMRGDINIFISEYSRAQWGWSEETADVIHHGVDTELFVPGDLQRTPHLLSVVNDWINRDCFCGYNLWKDVSKGLPIRVVGNTPGLSVAATTVDELVKEYQQSQVFLNTSLVSPVPTALLEAMSCGCAVVSTATCMIPEIIQNGVNGFISNEPQELRKYCVELLKDEALAQSMGEAARLTICEHFSMDNFVHRWNEIFEQSTQAFFTGD